MACHERWSLRGSRGGSVLDPSVPDPSTVPSRCGPTHRKSKPHQEAKEPGSSGANQDNWSSGSNLDPGSSGSNLDYWSSPFYSESFRGVCSRGTFKYKSCFLLLLILFTLLRPTLGASFFGSTYVSLPFQDAKSNTEVSFRFRTSRSESLLVLAAGKTDYCLIMLQQGILKVHVNLGAGETEVSSPLNIRLDDLKWHAVDLVRNNADIQLSVDKVHISRAQLPGRFYELNIHYGVFVGGMGDFNEVFLGNQKNFRGCMENVLFNSIDVMQKAEDAALTSTQAKVYNLEWDCSAQFDADVLEPLSFLSQDAYAAFPSWIPRTGGVISFSLKTISPNSVLLYNTGHASSKDFLALEIHRGLVRLMMDQGNGPSEVQHSATITDGLWHNVTLTFNSDLLELNLDGHKEVKRQARGPQKHIDLTDRLYVGGVVLKKKTRSLKDGLKSGGSGLQGCIQGLQLDGRSIGFPEALETFDVRSSCSWDFPCSRSPCVGKEVCSQDGMSGHTCTCTQPPCETSQPDLSGDFLEVTPVQVLEGGDVVISSEHIHVLLDYKQLGIPEREVFLHIIDPPESGALNFNPVGEDPSALSLEAFLHSGIRYSHAGLEDTEDSFVFEMSIGQGDHGHEVLKVRQRYIINIRILPVNDGPQLTAAAPLVKLPADSTLPLAPSFISIADPDTRLDQIVVVLTYNDTRDGYVEHLKRLGERVTSFRVSELQTGLLQYVHRGPLSTQFGLQAWDGELYSSTVNIRVEATRLEVSLVNNTGLRVILGGGRVITPANLSFSAGSGGLDPETEVRLELVSGPHYGKVQRQRSNGKWVTTRRFTQRQVDKGKVRYTHSRGNPRTDYFTFTALVNGNRVGKSFTFSIHFVNINIQAVRNHGLKLDNVLESVITESSLMYQTFPEETPDSRILYRLINTPREGGLLLTKAGGVGNLFESLAPNSTFSQVEILSGRLKYKLSGKPYATIKDGFSFEVSTPKQTSNVQLFDISYSPGDTSVEITLESCEVEEGGRKVISTKYLEIRSLDASGFLFNVTVGPVHGWLSVLATNKVDVLRQRTLHFTSAEVAEQRLVYHHDDSESRRDSFSFLASRAGAGRWFQYAGEFHVHILLRNDQTPTRAVDKVFHVVEGGEKLLTPADLLFTDMDIDTRPADIRFESRATPNGELVYAEDPSKRVSEFTQQDINDRKIMFRHRGSNFGRILIWVNDGQLWVSTELKVRAAKPFVKVENNTGIVVQRGDSTVLTSLNLSVETNMNVYGPDIFYNIVEGPLAGSVLVNDKPQTSFTEQDLIDGKVEYTNHENSTSTDFFIFKVAVGGTVYADDTVHIQVYPESYWDGLKIGSNNSLYVEEGTSVRISEDDLRVVHGEIAANDIKFTVTSGPKHGFLEIDQPSFLDQEPAPHRDPSPVARFSQTVINEGRLHYVQTSANQTRDSFSFDVSNGITSLAGLVFHFMVVPQDIYIETRPLRVDEGSSAFLSLENLNILTTFYEDKISDYLILEQPKHGSLVLLQRPNSNLTSFTVAQLAANQIKYIHDGSDSVKDHVLLVGRTEGVQWPDQDKTSVPTTLNIHINPTNDAVPRVVNNTGLTLWAGATVNISTVELAAIDADTSISNLTYQLSAPHCGMVSLWTRPGYPVSQFTETQLRQGLVSFTHSGCLEGGFSFKVWDGENSGEKAEFPVRVNQLSLETRANRELVVFPGSEAALTSSELEIQTTDSNIQKRNVLFLVSSEPTKGRLLYLTAGGRYEPALNFTQEDVHNRRILYRHEAAFKHIKDFDFFNFEAVADYAPYRLKSVFNIVISLTSLQPGGVDRYIRMEPLVCPEGGNATLYPQNFNTSGLIDFIRSGPGLNIPSNLPPLRMRLTSTPIRGKLVVRDGVAKQGDTFTQAEVNAGQITYFHDHSDTLEDRFGVDVYLVADLSGTQDILLHQSTLNISITPVNDRMPYLVTKNPSMVVVRGESAPLTRDMLEVQDPDTPPREIRFTVLDNGLQGRLVYTTHPSRSITTFTQLDVNEEKVVYQHDGASSQTQFYFSATDGRFQPRETGLSRHFRIHVMPLTLELRNQSVIGLDQGTTTAIITNRNMGAASNGDRMKIQYRLTSRPVAGQLLVEDRPAEVFYQVNIDREEVVYMQTNMSFSSDSFTAELSNLENKIPNLVFNISVKPLVRQEVPFVASVDNSTPLLAAHLDATKLAGLTNSNPVYYILSPPALGRIKRIIRTSRIREPRSLRDREVWHFTHEDLKNGVIYFVGSGAPLTRNSSDELRYRLEAPGVQPATGALSFTVVQSEVTPWPPLPNVTPEGLVPVHAATRKDIVIATSVVASLLLVIVSAIVIVKCRREKYSSQVLRPNGHICQISGAEARHRRNSNFDNVYDTRSGLMSLSKEHPLSTPRLTADRFLSNGTLSRHGGLPPCSSQEANISDSDSWMESSRSRETSPSSSIPPSLPAFRVIPLCESESSGTHHSDPPGGSLQPFSRNSNDFLHHVAASEAGSNPSESTLTGERSSLHGQPLLRRNQYWV